jgi:uncharacterized membrane protein (UPF0182 family)
MPTIPVRLILLGLFLAIFVAGPSLVRFYADWLWFGELGYRTTYSTIIGSQATLFTTAFVLSFVWLALNVRAATSIMRDVRPVFTSRDGIAVTLPGRRQARNLLQSIAMLVAGVIGLYAAAQWEVWLTWRYAVPFNQTDPVLGHDVGFYVFTIPFVQFVRGIVQTLVVLTIIACLAVYVLAGGIQPPSLQFRSFSVAPFARRHLAFLVALFLLLLAVGAWLHRAEFLIRPSTATFGANYVDANARMPIALALVAVCLIGAVLAIVQAYTPRRWPLPVAAALYAVVAIGGEVYSSMLQRFVVTPNEQARETPYIAHNIEGTRRAFALDQVERMELSGDAQLTREDLNRNASTLENVRLWDHAPLLDTFGSLQVIRTYYDFESVDNDRYMINGALRQVMLSARELNSAALQNPTWINERLTYTHGYGLTLGPVNQVTNEGLPVLFVRDLPPQTTVGLQVDEPSLYFGELSNEYVIVGTRAAEFHYPRGDKPEYTKYGGSGGVPLNSFSRKLIFALRFGSYQILLSDDITSESRILFNRRISTRVRTLAPFLTFDNDPYLVLADGRLFWLYDAYTTSGRYPYSTPVTTPGGPVNYIRNAVKVSIDAYNGTTTAYLADENDPIGATYARIFPGMFKPLSEMPEALRSHVRYPEDIFAVQSAVYRTYHMTQPAVYYNREDQWDVPAVEEQGESRAMQPYYTIMRLPGESQAEFIQMLPFTPRNRQNLAAWLVARSDGENYGKLRVFEFPRQKTVFGPQQVVARIRQDQTISPQITLWNQQGSQVIWGTLMVIPIEESIIYVRPLYLRAANGQIPELRRVVVAYQDQIVMERTLDEAIARVFGGPQGRPVEERAPDSTSRAEEEAPRVEAAPSGDVVRLAAEARAHYDRAIQAQRAGDWAKYGEELRLLGQLLEKMQALKR